MKKLIILSILLLFFIGCNNPVGFYGQCFGSYPVTIKSDKTISVYHGNIYGTTRGTWEKVDGGIRVSGLSGRDRDKNGIWKYGGNGGLISPGGSGYCKSPYSPD